MKGILRLFLCNLCVLLAVGGSARAQEAQYAEAVSLVQRGQFEQAFPLLQQILDRSPNNLKARNLMGIALSGAGRGAEANEQFRKVLEQAPDFLPALKNLGINELRLGQTREAASHLERALKLAPDDVACHWGLAEIAFSEHRFQTAADHYEHSGEMAARDPRVLVRFATSYAEIKQPLRAAEVIDKIPADADPKTQFQAGLILGRIDRYDEAKRRFELARPGYPDPYEIDYNLMLLSFKARDFAGAVRTGEQILAKGIRKAEVYSLMGRAFAGWGKADQAYEAYRAATNLEPLDETNYLDLIALCLEGRLYDRGLEIADIGLKLIPASDRLHIDRGVALVMKGQFEDAEHEFLTAEGLSPQGLAGPAMGLVLLQEDKVSEAIAVLSKQQVRSPQDPWTCWLLAEALYRSDATPGSAPENQAVESLQKSIELDGTLSQPRALLGKILLHRGEVDRALEELSKAAELDPQDVTTTYLLAQAYQKNGDHARARDLFAKVEKAKQSALETTRHNLMRMITPAPK
jgi:tetratricopeptide (TPR) repeat protein